MQSGRVTKMGKAGRSGNRYNERSSLLSEVMNMPDLTIDVRFQGKVSIVEPIGYINAHTAKDFETALQKLIDQNQHNIVINCRRLAYIASAGLGAIMGCI